MSKETALKNIQTIRNIGPKMAHMLYAAGYKTASEVLSKEPEEVWLDIEQHIPYEQRMWCCAYLQALWCGKNDMQFGTAPDAIKQRFYAFRKSMYGH